MIEQLREKIRQEHPLIHCITNPISLTQCANAILAVGGRPIMAEHPKEVAEITATAQALMLNLGNITDVRMESMQIALEEAKKDKVPVLLDVVGIACSRLRRDFAGTLLAKQIPTVIKGNYSEINALWNQAYCASGVDADHSLQQEDLAMVAVKLARHYHTVILASGKVDLITDGHQLVLMRNGSPQLATVTGTGCMLGALCSTYLSAGCGMEAAITACAMLSICGEVAETPKGSGSFLQNLMDQLSTLQKEEMDHRIEMEVRNVEETEYADVFDYR